MPPRDLTSKKFFRLTPIRVFRKDFDGYSKTFWDCLCDCGEKVTVAAGNLTSGNSRSCGCLTAETTKKRRRTHGHSGGVDTPRTHEYTCWTAMRTRCTNPNSKSWKYYGDRGIRICERWLNSFENFLKDIGTAPTAKHSLERIDSQGNYEPGNVRWATHKEQMNNVSRNHLVEYKGQKKTLAQWGEISGIRGSIIRSRLVNLGWSVEAALETPIRVVKKSNR